MENDNNMILQSILHRLDAMDKKLDGYAQVNSCDTRHEAFLSQHQDSNKNGKNIKNKVIQGAFVAFITAASGWFLWVLDKLSDKVMHLEKLLKILK